jgi:two-component system, LytTR family, response regulator
LEDAKLKSRGDNKKKKMKRLLIRSSGSLLFLNQEDIHWIEAKGKYSHLHCGRDQYPVRAGIQTLEGELDPESFIRIHRSYIVNIDSIRELKPWLKGEYHVLLNDGTELTWSRNYKDRFYEFVDKLALTLPARKSNKLD